MSVSDSSYFAPFSDDTERNFSFAESARSEEESDEIPLIPARMCLPRHKRHDRHISHLADRFTRQGGETALPKNEHMMILTRLRRSVPSDDSLGWLICRSGSKQQQYDSSSSVCTSDIDASWEMRLRLPPTPLERKDKFCVRCSRRNIYTSISSYTASIEVPTIVSKLVLHSYTQSPNPIHWIE